MARLVADLGPLRRHRHFRLLWSGQLSSAMGSQLTVVAVSLQAYRLTHSTFVVGLVSLVQLLPLVAGSIGGGPVVDATDRRRVLVVTQFLMALCSAGLAVNAALPHPALWPVFASTAASALFQGTNNPARRAAITAVVPPAEITGAVALQTMLVQWAFVVGPSLAGLLIAGAGLPVVYAIDVASFLVAIAFTLPLPPLVPEGGGRRAGVESIAEGLRFLRGQRLLAATFWIDLDAMIFGMPRAVFPAIGIGLYHGGAGTVGLLFAAPGIGGLAGSLLSGWMERIDNQGRGVVISVCLWGAAIAAFGLVPVAWAGVLLLALAGAADLVSAVFRASILQTTTPERLQGRLSGIYFAVVAGGPRLGDAETGAVAALAGPQVSVWSGGLACLAGVGLLLWRVPQLWGVRRGAEGRGVEPPPGEALGIAEATAELSETDLP
ncbi:MAG: MFS transporter [Acidobacteriota bacterium]|nr:MFS transporter [Acidobacteriota bacterium]